MTPLEIFQLISWLETDVLRDWLTNIVQAGNYFVVVLEPANQSVALVDVFPCEQPIPVFEWRWFTELLECFGEVGNDCLVVGFGQSLPSNKSLSEASARFWETTGVKAFLPFRLRKQLFGVVMIGARTGADGYSADSFRAMSFLSKQLNRAIAQRAGFQDQACLGGMSRGVAHDLHNLLTPIAACLQVIPEGREKALEMMPLALRSLETIHEYVDQARWFSEHNAPRLKRASINELVRRAVLLADGQLTSKGVSATVDLPYIVEAKVDPVLVLRLISNLLANAIEASPKDGVVELSLETVELGGGKFCRLRVGDEGSGISELHWRPAISRGLGGKINEGQGLAICQRIAALHSGQIEIFARETQGTIVQVDLPVRQEN